MGGERKIAMVGRTLSFAEAEDAEDKFWANASVEERLAETYRLRREHYIPLLGNYQEKVEIVVVKKKLVED